MRRSTSSHIFEARVCVDLVARNAAARDRFHLANRCRGAMRYCSRRGGSTSLRQEEVLLANARAAHTYVADATWIHVEVQ
jgi:hypothetical protein